MSFCFVFNNLSWKVGAHFVGICGLSFSAGFSLKIKNWKKIIKRYILCTCIILWCEIYYLNIDCQRYANVKNAIIIWMLK
jgi:hypothetical protein